MRGYTSEGSTNGWSSSDDVHETVCIGLRDIARKATRDTLVEIKASKRCAVIGEEGLLRNAWNRVALWSWKT